MKAEIEAAGLLKRPGLTSEERVYPYQIERPVTENRVERFLEAFAAVLRFTDYRALLESYCTSNAKCNRCAVTCPVFMATGDPRDIPCYRTNLLLDVYKRYFTIGGWVKSRLPKGVRKPLIMQPLTCSGG